MRIEGKSYRSVWIDKNKPEVVKIIDQGKLPFVFEIKELSSVEDVYNAISEMSVRGAPAIGVAGVYGMYLATLEITAHTKIREHLRNAATFLCSSRPTAINLSWAVNRVLKNIEGIDSRSEIATMALKTAEEICETEINKCIAIGKYGVELIKNISIKKNGEPVNILTHCNAGWLACVDYGTATAPVYMARDNGIQVHVWVDETRPKYQGARLTCFELENENIPHTLITDGSGGYLMQKGLVDLVITGSDRVTRCGDCANKIGTYHIALAAKDNNIPFYVAVPSSSFDLNISDGLKEIPVEERSPQEVTETEGINGDIVTRVRICSYSTRAVNYAFDITPARLITGLITEKGIIQAEENHIVKLFKNGN